MKAFLGLLCLPILISCGAGNEQCGELDGDAVIQPTFGNNPESCHSSVSGDLKINMPEGLRTVQMPYVSSVGGDLMIICNYELVTLDLGALEYVTGDVEIEGNMSLTSLDGLRSLRFVGGSLSIHHSHCKHPNAELADISGLDRLESVGGDILIQDNPKLPNCAAEALVERLKFFPGVATIDGNDTGATCD